MNNDHPHPSKDTLFSNYRKRSNNGSTNTNRICTMVKEPNTERADPDPVNNSFKKNLSSFQFFTTEKVHGITS